MVAIGCGVARCKGFVGVWLALLTRVDFGCGDCSGVWSLFGLLIDFGCGGVGVLLCFLFGGFSDCLA